MTLITLESREQRLTAAVVLAVVVLLGLLWAGAILFGSQVVQAIVDGRILGGLGEMIRIHMANNPDHDSIAFYVELVSAAAGRAFLLTAAFGGALVMLQQRHPDLLTDFSQAEGSAATLAVTRIVVFGFLVYSVNVGFAEYIAAQPSEMIRPPRFMGWFVGLVPISPQVAVAASWGLIVAGLLAAAGAFTRFSSIAAVLLAVYVFGLAQNFGKIDHGIHGMLWIAMILAVSPAGRILSLDALIRRSDAPTYGRSFGLPIRMIWLLFACIYFFPGFWKFVISGWEWALGENLKFKMYSAWLGSDYLPWFRIDQHPALYQSSALLSMLWEIAFPLLILFRPTRIAALALGAMFHLGVWEFMRIGPPMILLGYVAFIDLGGSWGIKDSPARLTRLAGSTVCGLVFLFGATLTNSWPFSVYPTHAGIRGPTYQTVEAEEVLPSGSLKPVDMAKISPRSGRAVDFAVIASPDTTVRNRYLRGLAERWKESSPSDTTASEPAVELRFYRAVRGLEPEARDDPPLERELLLSIPR